MWLAGEPGKRSKGPHKVPMAPNVKERAQDQDCPKQRRQSQMKPSCMCTQAAQELGSLPTPSRRMCTHMDSDKSTVILLVFGNLMGRLG